MIGSYFHPGDAAIDRFAHGIATERERVRVAAHMEHCADCRRQLQFARAVRAEAPAVPVPAHAGDTLDTILSRRAAGERVILPSTDPVTPPRRSSWVAAAGLAAATILIAIGLTLGRAPDIMATGSAGELRFSPAMPRPGQAVVVEYRPIALLAAEPELRLRARLRTQSNEAYDQRVSTIEIARLVRQPDGRFVTKVTIPDSVVFGAFAVEDTAGERIDANDGRSWEVLTTVDGAKPSLASLLQHKDAHMGGSWEEAHAAMRQAVQLYPDSPQAWSELRWFDYEVLGDAAADSLAGFHRPQFERLHRLLAARAAVPAGDMGAMPRYAAALGDSAAARYWEDRLLAEWPRHRMAVQVLLLRTLEALRRQDSLVFTRHPERITAAMDSILRMVGGAEQSVYLAGSQAANASREPSLIRRWSDLYLTKWIGDSAAVAAKFARYPELRAEGLRRLREMASAVTPSETKRPLGRSRSTHAIRDRERVAEVWGALGDALVLAGQIAAGADTLERAALLGWDVELTARAAAALRKADAPERARRFEARLAVDPGTADSTRTALASRAIAESSPSAWQELLTNARDEMRAQVLATSAPRSLPSTSLLDADGRRTTLRDATGKKAAVVVVWSMNCGWALDDLPQLAAFGERMRAQGVPVVVVSSHPLDARALELLDDAGVRTPAYHDHRGELVKAFRNFSTPAYYVLDADGRLRFSRSMRVDIPRQLAAIGG
ncbi:MAG TPA: redoxin domain-containing protein [Gemmatimonadaceae bacterium]|nr:redoxin domain-containing protein [Gemmatimonadaceae bacterium]